MLETHVLRQSCLFSTNIWAGAARRGVAAEGGTGSSLVPNGRRKPARDTAENSLLLPPAQSTTIFAKRSDQRLSGPGNDSNA